MVCPVNSNGAVKTKDKSRNISTEKGYFHGLRPTTASSSSGAGGFSEADRSFREQAGGPRAAVVCRLILLGFHRCLHGALAVNFLGGLVTRDATMGSNSCSLSTPFSTFLQIAPRTSRRPFLYSLPR